MAKKAKKTVQDYPHFEEKRNVKIWTKKAGKSFQMSIEGIGGRFYGSLTRKMDGETVGDFISPTVQKSAKAGSLKSEFKKMDKKAKLNLLLELLA